MMYLVGKCWGIFPRLWEGVVCILPTALMHKCMARCLGFHDFVEHGAYNRGVVSP